MQISSIVKPEYFYRPQQIVANLKRRFQRLPDDIDLSLPWQIPIRVRSNDEIGRAILSRGVYDLPLTEAIWRLTQPGDLCVDVGANLGYASSLLALRAGSSGRVYAIEPHPELFRQLQDNCSRWRSLERLAQVEPIEIGLSNSDRRRALNIPPDFSFNRGMSHFYKEGEKPEITAGEIEVSCTTLDLLCEERDITAIGVLKIDVEGHEIEVMEGTRRLLERKAVREIIFEDSRANWLPIRKILGDYSLLYDTGYSIYQLRRSFWGPKLVRDSSIPADKVWQHWEAPSFIATSNPENLETLFSHLGWRCL